MLLRQGYRRLWHAIVAPDRPALWLILTVAGGWFALLVAASAGGWFVNWSQSAAVGIWRTAAEPAVVGDWVVACLPEQAARLAGERGYLKFGRCPGEVQPVLKRLVAMPGDYVRTQPESLWVNGVALAHSTTLKQDNRGRRLSASDFENRLAWQQFWLHSPAARSFDSRYFGPVSSVMKATPWIVF